MLHRSDGCARGSSPAVYGHLDPRAALLETWARGRYGIPYEKRMPLVMVPVDMELKRVLDDLQAPA